MEHIGKHMAALSARSKKEKATERGEMMKYFMERLNPAPGGGASPPLSLPRMGRLLVAIPTKDLYYLRSVCEQSKDFSKKFWWEIKPKSSPTEGSGLPKKHYKKDES